MATLEKIEKDIIRTKSKDKRVSAKITQSLKRRKSKPRICRL